MDTESIVGGISALDVGVLLVLALGTVHGWRKGLLAQLLGLGTLIAVWIAAPRLVPILRAWLLHHGQTPGLALELGCVVVAVGLVLIVCFALVSVIPEAVHNWSRTALAMDRGLGAAAGLLRGLILTWLLLATASYAEPSLVRAVPALREPMRQSSALAVARTWNVWQLVDPSHLHALRTRLARGWSPDERAPLLLRQTLADPALRNAAADPTGSDLLLDPRILELLQDRETAAWLQADPEPAVDR